MHRLVPAETTTLDPDALARLVHDIGPRSAERAVGCALDDIFWALERARAARIGGRNEDVLAALRVAAERGRLIGLTRMARVADDAAATAARADTAGSAATFARLERLFEGAVDAVGQGLSRTV